jgi:hypothetical protein
MTFELEIDVPPNHRVTLPPEVPAGRVKLHVTWEAEGQPGGYGRRKLHPSLVADEDAYIRMLPELLKTHSGKYVAIVGGKLVAATATKADALREGWKHSDGEVVFVQLVSDEPQPVERLPGIREIPRGADA